MLKKVRLEEQDAIEALAIQVSDSLSRLVNQIRLMQEETQILWWLFGETSRTLNKPFRSFTAPQAAVLAGLELGQLTNVTSLGPVAAPAMLERVIDLAGGESAGTTIAAVIDGFEADDLAKLRPPAQDLLPRIYPLMTGITKAIDIGQGSWHAAFEKATGVNATTEISSVELASQVYAEHLLGQLT
jgi:GTPase-associated system helical domain